MNIELSPTLLKAISAELSKAEAENAILDVYGVAENIQKQHPSENVALEDIVQKLLTGRGAVGVIEFTPRSPTILDVVMPGPVGESAAELRQLLCRIA
jgi:hypothetical protein